MAASALPKITDLVPVGLLEILQESYLNYLHTSAAIFERDGTYAAGLITSQYCKYLTEAGGGKGRGICREDCWRISRKSIELKTPYSEECFGGLTIYSVPIMFEEEPIGTAIAAVSNPPKDMQTIKRVAERFGLTVEDIQTAITTHEDRPKFVLDAARKQVEITAKTIGTLYGILHRLRRKEEAITKEAVERKRAEEEMREARLYAESIVETVREPLVVLDADLRVVSANRSFYDTFKVSEKETKNHLIYELGNRQWDIPRLRTLLEEILPKNSHFQDFEVDHEFPVIGRRTMLLNARRIHRKGVGTQLILLAIEDITERKRLHEKLDYTARYDMPTGLPNRLLFRDRTRQAIARAGRKKQQVAVLLVYLGRLSSVHELFGHRVCNTILQTVARRLTDSARAGGDISVGEEPTVGRLSEYEFAVLLQEIAGPRDAARLAQRIISALSKDIVVDERRFVLTCSVGISIYPSDGSEEEALLRNAAIAILGIKETGRSDYQFYSPRMGEKISERLALENSLHKAIQQGELEVYYQPQVSLDTGRVTGMEALVRWRHPERGLVPPAEFIPLAEETGLIIPLGEWVLHTACTQGRAWYDEGLPPIRISINFSVHQFQRQNVTDIVAKATKETGLDPHRLEIEITESALMEGKGITIPMLHELSAMGTQISIDDFGTGYSSLSYLRNLPVSKLKIDQSFVRDISIHPSADAIVAAIISMAHSLHLKVNAEGVGTVEQLEFLRTLKCDEVQGHLFSRPLPAEEATKLLTEGRRLEPAARGT